MIKRFLLTYNNMYFINTESIRRQTGFSLSSGRLAIADLLGNGYTAVYFFTGYLTKILGRRLFRRGYLNRSIADYRRYL